MRRRDRGLPFDAERAALWAMAALVAIFFLHSAIDWTWSVPGNVVPALLCAGWIAGRGPLRRRLLAAPAVRTAGPAPVSRARRIPEWLPPPVRVAAIAVAVVLAVVAAWTAYQPVRSVHAGDEALERLEQRAFEPAAAIARIAVDRNPLSVDPLFELAAIEQARGQTPEAERALERAVQVQPANAETWRRLGRLRLEALSKPGTALTDFQAAYYLDPQNPESWSDLIRATRAVKEEGGG